MINEELLDFTNENLLDSNIVGKRRNYQRSRQRFSNQDGGGGGGVDYGALATATAGLASTIANRPRNEAKDAARGQKKQVRQERRATKKDMKTVCGRKPLLKKKRGEWDKCVADYMKQKQPTTPPAESSQTYKSSSPQDYSQPSSDSSSDKKTEKKFLGMPQTTGIIVALVAVGVIGFVGYKMFFAKKGAAAATPAATPTVG